MDKKRFRFKLDRDKIKLQLKDLGEQLRNKKGVLKNIALILLFLSIYRSGFFYYRNVQEGKDEVFTLIIRKIRWFCLIMKKRQILQKVRLQQGTFPELSRFK